jgi:DNA mismatch endonuclease (patch repair protein)
MVDRLTPDRRSWLMSRVRGKDTAPEWIVRRIVHGLGYRYRLHGAHLPGKPDLVLAGRKKIIFVHGCFWHGHDCRWGKRPKSNVSFWKAKAESNRARDARNELRLRELGWEVCVVWQCETRNPENLRMRLVEFLRGDTQATDSGPGMSYDESRVGFGAGRDGKADRSRPLRGGWRA